MFGHIIYTIGGLLIIDLDLLWFVLKANKNVIVATLCLIYIIAACAVWSKE